LPPGLALNATTGALTGVPAAAGRYGRIIVTAANGEGSASQTFAIVVQPAPLVISADNKTKHVGTPNPPLTASYYGFVLDDTPAGLDSPLTLTTTAELDSPVGTYGIMASGAADANYAVTFVTGKLTVSAKLVPAITWASPPPISYGTVLGAAQLNAIADVPGIFTYNPPAETRLASGRAQPLLVTFQPDDGASYAVVEVAISIDVLRAALTIRADDKIRAFGTPNPPLTVTYDGLVSGEMAADLDVPVAVSTTASMDSTPGLYPIIASSAADADYEITFVSGSLVISSRRTYVPVIGR
jgi:hypothetical protein